MSKCLPILDPTKPAALLQACPVYRPTPLRRFISAAKPLWLKDETGRMGQEAFKVLGGFYAVARLLEEHVLKAAMPEVGSLDVIRAKTPKTVFVCASAGNHGMAVAAGARVFGAKARVHLSAQVSEKFATRLQNKGAEVVRSGETYEESVAAAVTDAENTGAIHLADGSWPGYTEPPRLVMEGYTVIAEEIRHSFEKTGQWPSHIFLQAGVGGLAAAMAYMIRHNWSVQPEIVVVEPDCAACLGASVKTGQLVAVAGPVSAMGRLDCKIPSLLAFNILQATADRYVTVSDKEAAQAAKTAASFGIQTTSSGAAGLAALLREQDQLSNPLTIISEGAIA
jgi:diaminopropionate ammonia-lyase